MPEKKSQPSVAQGQTLEQDWGAYWDRFKIGNFINISKFIKQNNYIKGDDLQLRYLIKDDLLRIHQQIIARFGKESGVLSESNLEATLLRVEGYKGEDEEALLWKAAILLEMIALGHPFIDGNKRTAYEATKVFLKSNGYDLSSTENEAIELLVGIVNGKKNRFSIKAWLTTHSKRI